jgi:Protein of unknown function (DUF2948)
VLKLRAQDSDDLSVIAAQMQDALVRQGDMHFDARRRRFALVANRFAWDAMQEQQRRRSGLHFDNVLAVKRKGFANANAETILSLLTIRFTETNAPSGRIELVFAAGHAVLLDVEYLDAALADLGPVWSATATPQHDV